MIYWKQYRQYASSSSVICCYCLPSLALLNNLSAICLLQSQTAELLRDSSKFFSHYQDVSFFTFWQPKCEQLLFPSSKYPSSLLTYKSYALGKQKPKSVTISCREYDKTLNQVLYLVTGIWTTSFPIADYSQSEKIFYLCSMMFIIFHDSIGVFLMLLK